MYKEKRREKHTQKKCGATSYIHWICYCWKRRTVLSGPQRRRGAMCDSSSPKSPRNLKTFSSRRTSWLVTVFISFGNFLYIHTAAGREDGPELSSLSNSFHVTHPFFLVFLLSFFFVKWWKLAVNQDGKSSWESSLVKSSGDISSNGKPNVTFYVVVRTYCHIHALHS